MTILINDNGKIKKRYLLCTKGMCKPKIKFIDIESLQKAQKFIPGSCPYNEQVINVTKPVKYLS